MLQRRVAERQASPDRDIATPPEGLTLVEACALLAPQGRAGPDKDIPNSLTHTCLCRPKPETLQRRVAERKEASRKGLRGAQRFEEPDSKSRSAGRGQASRGRGTGRGAGRGGGSSRGGPAGRGASKAASSSRWVTARRPCHHCTGAVSVLGFREFASCQQLKWLPTLIAYSVVHTEVTHAGAWQVPTAARGFLPCMLQ